MMQVLSGATIASLAAPGSAKPAAR